MANRREFISIMLAGTAAATALQVRAQAGALSESDPTAMALGYKADASKVDKSKFPKYAAGQSCANCQLYGGKATDASAPCPTFGNKVVAGKGWCNAWVKKA
jgi:hypothetical protein